MTPAEVRKVLHRLADEWPDFYVHRSHRRRWQYELSNLELGAVFSIIARRRDAGLPAPLDPFDLLAVPGEGPAPAVEPDELHRAHRPSRDW